MTLFGINEFAARLPSPLSLIAALVIAARFARGFRCAESLAGMVAGIVSVLFHQRRRRDDGCGADAGGIGCTVCRVEGVRCNRARAAPRRWRIGFWILIGIGALEQGIGNMGAGWHADICLWRL